MPFDLAQLAQAAANIDTAEISELMQLRVLLDNQDHVQNIELDLQDLYYDPKRLTQSYPHEWRVFIKRAIHIAKREMGDNVTEILATRLKHRADWCERIAAEGLRLIEEIEAVANADNVTLITQRKRPPPSWRF